jgi:hypothetical protein
MFCHALNILRRTKICLFFNKCKSHCAQSMLLLLVCCTASAQTVNGLVWEADTIADETRFNWNTWGVNLKECDGPFYNKGDSYYEFWASTKTNSREATCQQVAKVQAALMDSINDANNFAVKVPPSTCTGRLTTTSFLGDGQYVCYTSCSSWSPINDINTGRLVGWEDQGLREVVGYPLCRARLPNNQRVIALSSGEPVALPNSNERDITLTATVKLDGKVMENTAVNLTIAQHSLARPFIPVLYPLNGAQATDANGQFIATLRVPITNKTETFTVVASCWPGACANLATQVVSSGPAKIVVGFFNGVSNTERDARRSSERLETEYGQQYKDTPLKYELFYNDTACREGFTGKVSCLEDVAEVFAQRANELDGVFADRWEIFWDVLAGRHQQSQSITGRLLSLLGDGGNAIVQWLDSLFNAVFNRLAAILLDFLTLFTNAPTTINQAEHLSKLQSYDDDGYKFLLVAHSQGNLFVNRAYDGLRASRSGVRAQVLHVAPASPTLRGEYTLADIDIVINGLRVTGINSVPNANVSLPFSSEDASGHGFEPTYLDKTRAGYANIRQKLEASLEALTQ